MSPKSATWAETVAAMSGRTVADIEEHWSERSAIREYLGGLSREEAERTARVDIEKIVLSKEK